MPKNFSQKAKITYCKNCKQRDGEICLYCKKPLGKKYVLEHLNDDRSDNRLENFCLAHPSCNVAKKYHADYQILAKEKLLENESALFIPIEDKTDDEASTEIKISKNNFDIVEQYLSEKIVLDEKISWDDALYGATYKCKKLTGFGSVQCIRNYLKILTSSESKFMQTKDESKNKIIVRRTGN